MNVAVYLRVSTDAQELASQTHAINEWMARTMPGVTPVVYQDQGMSGKVESRPGFQELCAAIKRGEVKAVVVYRLDRLSRNAVTAMKLLIEWIQGGVEFFATDQPILQLGASNPFRLTFCSLMAEVAQIEREAIVARVNAGLRAAKARGVKLGRKETIPAELKKQARDMRMSGVSLRRIAAHLDISLTHVARICDK